MCSNTNTTKRNVGPLNLNASSASLSLSLSLYLAVYSILMLLIWIAHNISISINVVVFHEKLNFSHFKPFKVKLSFSTTSEWNKQKGSPQTHSNDSRIRLHFLSRTDSMCLIMYYEISSSASNERNEWTCYVWLRMAYAPECDNIYSDGVCLLNRFHCSKFAKWSR